MTIGSLFSGIGGLELGLETATHGSTVYQVEFDPFCREVLAHNWPYALRFPDVTSLHLDDLPPVDLICGGFPCQAVSDAARGRNDGKTLWPYMRRVVQHQKPEWVVVENVDGAAWRRWLPGVRRDLWTDGYASVPIRLRASDVGAPHRGSRIFVAATNSQGQSARALNAQVEKLPQLAKACRKNWGQPPSRALGVADGTPHRLDRLRAVGNAVVPACAELIGRFIQLGKGYQ